MLPLMFDFGRIWVLMILIQVIRLVLDTSKLFSFLRNIIETIFLSDFDDYQTC